MAAPPAFLADWTDVFFLHFAIDPAILQPHVPFQLDLHEGLAYVSLVDFTQRNLRPARGGQLAALLHRPVATHEVLNLRTYVRHAGVPGIQFLAEWVPNRLSALVGPLVYGLPLRIARIAYSLNPATGLFDGAIDARRPAGRERLTFDGAVDLERPFRPAAAGLDAFLLERYVAYTRRNGVDRRFRIAHAPWRTIPAVVRLRADDLIARAAPWWHAARPAGAHYARGAFGVAIGPPERLARLAHVEPVQTSS